MDFRHLLCLAGLALCAGCMSRRPTPVAPPISQAPQPPPGVLGSWRETTVQVLNSFKASEGTWVFNRDGSSLRTGPVNGQQMGRWTTTSNRLLVTFSNHQEPFTWWSSDDGKVLVLTSAGAEGDAVKFNLEKM